MESCFKVLVLLLLVSVVLSSYEPISRNNEDHRRKRNSFHLTWKYTQFRIKALSADMATYELAFCDGNPFAGIQCPEERLCASWPEICDGVQSCALKYRDDCLNQSRISFGNVDPRICDGDENRRWCGWKRSAPQRCGEDFVIKNGHARSRVIRIMSPNWPGRYSNDRFCYWTVQAPEGHQLSVRVRKFRTERNYDIMSIGNGLRYDDENSVIIFRHSGTDKPAQKKFNTRGNKLWVSFRSDDRESDKGFHLEISDTLRYDAKVAGRNPFRGNQPIRECGGDVTLEANQDYQITSPGYPEPYPDNHECIWIVRMPLGRRMEIEFEIFELEDELDYISVGNGDNTQIRPLLFKYSGRTGPAKLLSQGNVVWIKFFSSLAISRDGFVINLKDYPNRECGPESITIKTISEGTTMTVASPNYPEPYEDNHQCLYRFQADPGRRLLVRVLDFTLERGYDWFAFGNGFSAEEEHAIVWGHSGRDLPDPVEFVSNSTEAWIYFNTDFSGGERGFLAEVYDVAGS